MFWHTMRDVLMLRALRVRTIARGRQLSFRAKFNQTPTFRVQLYEPSEVKAIRERLQCTV
tara:strand:+ start:1162 stop:1341 length:180 start_codon:yes stop_codon:yes gene_type:complete